MSKNKININSEYIEVELYNKIKEVVGLLITDLEYIDFVKLYRWHLDKDGYAQTKINGKNIRFHRYILNAKQGEFVDHINHNRLDCRKNNLKICSKTENNRNTSPRRNSKSGIVGVQWNKATNKWLSLIVVDGNRKNLGYYEKLEDAITIRLVAEKEYFGESAPQKHLYEQYNVSNKNLDDFHILKPKERGKNGVKGITWIKKRNKWNVYLCKKNLGYHSNYDDAVRIRLNAEIQMYGYDDAPQRHLFKKYNISKDDYLCES